MDAAQHLAGLRLVAQQLAGPRSATPLDAVTHLGAVQAQDLPGALLSVALRTSARSHAEVVEAFARGEIVRSWPMRGTLHLVPAVDLGWMLSLTGPRMISGSNTRRLEVGITDQVLGTARELALTALDGGVALPRPELFSRWREADLLPHSQSAVHLLGRLCQETTLVLGPLSGREQLVVSYADWIPQPRHLDREEALAELARRFLRSHGPATVADLARWASLSLTEARAGVAGVRSEFDSITVGDMEHLFDPDLPDHFATHRAEAERLLLLPGFDEYILGYADRSFAVPAEWAQQLVPGNNGMFRSSIIKNTQVIGTWKRGGTPKAPRPTFDGFSPLGEPDRDAAAAAFAALPWP